MLYDVSSSYLEGRCCELARHGDSRDHRPDRLQIVYSLLCDRDGRPVAIEVFEGDTGDPSTLPAQIEKLKRRFGLRHLVLIGDRGMITQAQLREDLKPAGLDWITSLRAPQIQALAEGGALQLSLFDERNLAEITAPDYPGERLIVCRNPDLARERPQARGPAGRHQARPFPNRRPGAPAPCTAARPGGDRACTRSRDHQPQDGQALRADRHR